MSTVVTPAPCKDVEPSLAFRIPKEFDEDEQDRIRDTLDDINKGNIKVTHTWGKNYTVKKGDLSISVHTPNQRGCIELTGVDMIPIHGPNDP